MTLNSHIERIAQILEDAADYIRAYGHHKGSLYAAGVYSPYDKPPACVVGALSAEADGIGLTAARLAGDAVAMHLGVSHLRGELADWNDEPDRTAEEVIEALLATAKKLRNGEPLWSGTRP